MLKILATSDCSKDKTGFGRTQKILLQYLYKKGYDIVEYAQGRKKNDPYLKSLPWKAIGSIPDSDEEFLQLAGGDARNFPALRYGPIYINEIIQTEKPDLFIGGQDCWAFEFPSNQIWWNKIPCISWMTFDSLPLYKNTIENIEKFPLLWVKADFAQKELARLGIKAECVPDLINPNEFYPVSDEERDAFRARFGLEDTVIFGFVFKNQLRKLCISLLEGYQLYKDQNSESKAKLFLYTDFNVQGSWDIPYAIKELGINPDDVLCCYFCRNCRRFEIKAYKNVSEDCPFCGAKDTFRNPDGQNFGVNERELNLIYNMMDAVFHPHTSGGFEMPILEAIYAGLPVATTGYSSGEMYTDSGLVENIKFHFYRDHNGSNFKKATAIPESIAEIMEKFYSFGREGRVEYGKKAREWALKKFDCDKWLNWIDNYLTSLPRSRWNYEMNYRNSEFPIPECENDEEFLIKLHEGVFGISPDKKTRSDMMRDMKGAAEDKEKGVSGRQWMHHKLTTIAKELNQKVTPKPEMMIRESDKKKIIFILQGSYKEAIIALPVLMELKEKYKDWDYYISTGPESASIVTEVGAALVPYFPASFWNGKVDKILNN